MVHFIHTINTILKLQCLWESSTVFAKLHATHYPPELRTACHLTNKHYDCIHAYSRCGIGFFSPSNTLSEVPQSKLSCQSPANVHAIYWLLQQGITPNLVERCFSPLWHIAIIWHLIKIHNKAWQTAALVLVQRIPSQCRHSNCCQRKNQDSTCQLLVSASLRTP